MKAVGSVTIDPFPLANRLLQPLLLKVTYYEWHQLHASQPIASTLWQGIFFADRSI